MYTNIIRNCTDDFSPPVYTFTLKNLYMKFGGDGMRQHIIFVYYRGMTAKTQSPTPSKNRPPVHNLTRPGQLSR